MDERFEKGNHSEANSFALFATNNDGTGSIGDKDAADITNAILRRADADIVRLRDFGLFAIETTVCALTRAQRAL